MIEQPQAPRTQSPEPSVEQNQVPITHQQNSEQGDSEFNILLKEVKQLRQDVLFLKQLLEHVQKDLH